MLGKLVTALTNNAIVRVSATCRGMVGFTIGPSYRCRVTRKNLPLVALLAAVVAGWLADHVCATCQANTEAGPVLDEREWQRSHPPHHHPDGRTESGLVAQRQVDRL